MNETKTIKSDVSPLASIELLGAARYFKIGDSVTMQGKRIIGTVEEINGSIVSVDWGLHSSGIHFADLEFAE